MTTNVAQKPQSTETELFSAGAVDCDVHNLFKKGLQDLAPYLAKAWQQKFGLGDNFDWAAGLPGMVYQIPTVHYVVPGGTMRVDAIPPDGGAPASDPAYAAIDLLDRYQFSAGVLTGGNVLSIGGMPDPDAAAVIASAYNEWLAEVWLDADPRYKGSILIAPRDPARAVAEIEKWAKHPAMVQVFVPDIEGVTLGRRHNWPILEAAEHFGLPVATHPGGQASGANSTGLPSLPPSFCEFHAALSLQPQAHLLSLVMEGVFERFPKLKVLMMEGGFSWLVHSMWRMDKDWKALRHEVPWVKRPPSEYIREHVRASTQPLEEAPSPREMEMMLELMHGDEMLLFSTDYPHWDADDPLAAFASMNPETRRKIMVDNATEFFPRLSPSRTTA